MATPLTRCPECSSKITNRFECRNCGLLFDRYFKAQARKRKEDQIKAAQKKKTAQIINIAVTTLVVVVIGVGAIYYYLTSKNQSQVATTSETPKQEQSTTMKVTASTQETAPKRAAVTVKSGSNTDIAFNATAVILTPWGPGTGFFIQEDKFLTNKHIAQFGEEQLEKEIQQFNENKELIDEKKATIKELKKQAEATSDTQIKSEVEVTIQKREARLEKRLAKHQEQSERITRLREEIKAPNISIILDNGKTVYLAYMETSSNHDLALLTILSNEIPGVKFADTPLNEGEILYSLGKNTTSIKSTFTGYSDKGYIKTDKPVIPSYSGGPLTNDKGEVLAISILPAADQKDIGLAIPIATVKQEFGL